MSDVQVQLPSQARRVTLYEDRAEVVRTVRASLVAGSQWIAIAGVTPFIDDRSLQARLVEGEGAVVAARVRRRVHHEQALGREAIAALEDELRTARGHETAARSESERAAAAQTAAQHMLDQWMKSVAQVPRLASEPERLAEWRAAHEQLVAALEAALARAQVARVAGLNANDDAVRAQQRLDEGLRQRPRRDTVVEVQIDAARAGEALVELVYRTPCALWRPEHLARLRSDGAAAPAIELVTYATAWQHTGERWDDVEAVFSTARTGSAAEPPRLVDDVLAQRKKTDEERKRVVVEAREQVISAAGLDRGARAVDEMPGVDDGGEPLSFAPAARVSLVSDGRPFRVEIARAVLPAETALVLYPEKALAAHLRATASNSGSGGAPLLAGPVTVAREASLVGRAKLGFVGAGEPFELGFGVADEMRVRRDVSEDRETATLTGRQTVKRIVRLYLSNLGGTARKLEITERIPVSELEDVQVHMTDGSWTVSSDGFTRRTIELPANDHKTLTLDYEIRAPAGTVLPN